jgi:GGDEF domain-containing protein
MYRHDSLTGLKIRRDFEIKFTEFFTSGEDFFLTLVDVNGLHALNRDENYAAGDRLIKYVAAKFIDVSEGMVYRIGGDEFASISFHAPIPCFDKTFTSTSVWSKDFNSSAEMFNGADSQVIELKEKFYCDNKIERRERKLQN